MRCAMLTLLLCASWGWGGCGDDSQSGNETNNNQSNTNTNEQSNTNEPVSYGMCGQWVEGTMDTDDGATRDYYNRGASLPWRNYLGDWHDASDIAQGDAPFAMTTLVDDNTPDYVQWDVTTLVQAWVDGDYHPRGFLLRAVGGDGTYNFYSKEHPVQTERPELVIVNTDGEVILSPEADTYLAPSTYQGFGDDVQLSLSSERPMLLRFDLSGLDPAAALQSATLRLYEFEDYGGGTLDVGVFRSSQGLDEPDDGPELGLAADYPGDASIGDHPDVLLFSDFESADWGLDWTVGTDAETLDLVTDDSDNQFEQYQGQALRVVVPEGELTGMGLAFKFADEVGAEPEEIYFRYYLRIGDDWWPDFGGKLPGISGTYGVAGWGGRPSDGTDGWSARGTFELPVADGNPYGGYTPIGSYVYHADMEGIYGDVDLWQRGCRGLLQRNQWYAIEQYLRMNTPGEQDGVLRAWVDGRLAYERTNWRWRTVDTLKIEQIWMNVYHGGTAPAPADIHLYFDNVVIARSYIGPMVTP
jgi:Disaggregatase related repeat/Polysaccharide lyase 14